MCDTEFGLSGSGMVEEKGRSLLNDSERATLRYYLAEYQQGSISCEALVLALMELLNTQAKVSFVVFLFKKMKGLFSKTH